VVFDRVEGSADCGVLGGLEDGPEGEVVTVPGSEGDAGELGGGMQVGGHGLGECPRAPVLERGRVEVVQFEQVGEGDELRPQGRDGLGGRDGTEAAGQRRARRGAGLQPRVGDLAGPGGRMHRGVLVVLHDVVELERERRIRPETGEDLEQTCQQGGAGVDGAEVALPVVPPAVKPPIDAGPLPARPGPGLRLLLPGSIIAAFVFLAGGVVQNFTGFNDVSTLAGGVQTLPGGPVASQEAIKMFGTNGGGFFNANSAHPFSNPAPWTNSFQIFLLLVIPFALPRTYGRIVGDRRHGYVLLATMVTLFLFAFAFSPGRRWRVMAPRQSWLGPRLRARSSASVWSARPCSAPPRRARRGVRRTRCSAPTPPWVGWC